METKQRKARRGAGFDPQFNLDLQKSIEIAQEFILPKAEDVLLEYIERYWIPGMGRIEPLSVHEHAVQASTIMMQAGPQNYEKENVTCTSDNAHLIATGVLEKDVNYVDSDPYETAGGYINGVAKAGTPFQMFINYTYNGFSIHVEAAVNITVDHYNNNFYGVSTGNGTKNYEIGQRVENKVIARGKDLGDFWNGGFKIKKIDLDKIHNFILSR